VADIFLSLLGLIISTPLFCLVAILIRLDSKGPVVFAHTRVGKGGVPFQMYKFRSMVPDAQERMKRFTPEQKKEFSENYKLNHDPRITKIGKFLRKTSLDELPQLLNVLAGSISLVGPRPLVAAEIAAKYGDRQSKLLSVKPGLTGYWQVNGRCNTTYDERIALELYYVDHASFPLDAQILLRTVAVVLKRVGAK
jgi:lipopolysaccharide/colanic/teichoic acid biosynthesis glycosyltransferase